MAVVLALGTAATAPAAPASIQLGAYVREAPGSARVMDEYAALVGQRPSIVMWYRSLVLPLMFSSETTNLKAKGGTPMVSLEPVDAEGNDIPLSQIAAGRYDGYLHEAAEAAKSWGGRILIRFAYEMNLNPSAGIPWGGGPGAYSGNSPADFIAAWRHAVGIFRSDGASNAEWVWAPNVNDGEIPFQQYFPGDEWVDDVGLDGYNWGSAFASKGHSWLSLGDTFSSSYATLTQLSSKPVIITETASAEQGGEKAAWIREGFLNELPRLFPRVSGVVWFDVQKEADWRVDSSEASLAAFREVAASSLYGGPVPYQPAEPSPPVVEEVQVTKKIHTKPRHPRRTARPRAHRRGRIRYRLSKPATVRILVEERGRSSWHVTLRRRSGAGRHVVRFSTRLAGHRLRPGSYRVTVRAIADGRRSRDRRAGFRVVRR